LVRRASLQFACLFVFCLLRKFFLVMLHSMLLEQALSSHFGTSVQILRRASLSGGSIHHAERLETSAGTFFVKHNHASHHENFLAEVDGLERLRQTRTLRVPQTILVAQRLPIWFWNILMRIRLLRIFGSTLAKALRHCIDTKRRTLAMSETTSLGHWCSAIHCTRVGQSFSLKSAFLP